MKKRIILLLWSLIIGLSSMAQTAEPCIIKNISTDPSDSQNIPESWDGSPYRLLEWIANSYLWQIGDNPVSYNNPNIFNPHKSDLDPDFQFLLSSDPYWRDNKPSEGWELMAYNNGTEYRSSGQYFRGGSYSQPYIILYNKYRAILRAFFYYDRGLVNQDYDVASVILYFDKLGANSKQSANLTPFAEYYEAIENFPKELYSQTANTLSIAGYQWIFADFPMAYDPCVCQFDYDKLQFRVDLVDRADVTLDGNIKTLDVINKSKNKNDITKGLAGGLEIGRDLTKALKVYESDKKLVTSLVNLYDNYQIQDLSKNKNYLLDQTGALKTMGEIFRAMPYAGLAFSVLDNFSADGSTTSKPTAISFKAELDLKGYIEYKQDDAVNYYMRVPGSKKATHGYNDEQQPIFDEPMGVINLMESPEIEYVDYYADYNSFGEFKGFGNGNRGVLFDQWQPFIRQYKTKTVPKVAINPAAGLELIDLKYTYRVKYTGQQKSNSWFDSDVGVDINSMFQCWTLNGFVTSMENFNLQNPADHLGIFIGQNSPRVNWVTVKPYPILEFQLDQNYKGYNVKFKSKLNKIGMDYEHYSVLMPEMKRGILNTSYLPYSYLPYQTFYLYSGISMIESDYCQNNIYYPVDSIGPEIELKISAVFGRTDGSSSEFVTHQIVYPVIVSESEQNKDNDDNPQNSVTIIRNGNTQEFHLVSPNGWQQPMWSDPLRLPFDLRLENTTVGPGDVQALNNIYIGDNVTIAPGTNFYAGNAIESTGSLVDVPPTTVMEIRPPVGVTPLQPQDYLLSDASPYCVDTNKYNPEVSQKRNVERPITQKVPVTYDEITLHPNPAHDIVHLSGIDPEQVERVICLDALGRMIHQWEGYTAPLDVSMLQPGMYLIQVRYSDGRVSESYKLGIAN